MACSLLLSGDVRSYVVVGRGHVAGLLLVHGRAFCAVDVPVEVLVAQLLSCHPMESQRSVSRLATDLCAGFRVLGAFSINRCRSARDRKLELRNRGQPSVAFGTASAPNPAPTALNGPPPPARSAAPFGAEGVRGLEMQRTENTVESSKRGPGSEIRAELRAETAS